MTFDPTASPCRYTVPAFGAFVRAYTAHERAVAAGVAVGALRGAHAEEAASDYRRVADEVLRDHPRGG